MDQKYPQIEGPKEFNIDVTGEGRYQAQFLKACGPRRSGGYNIEVRAHLALVDDISNDPFAVEVFLENGTVGFLLPKTAKEFREAVIAGGLSEFTIFECAANVRGGWDEGNGDVGSFGIWLDLPEDDEEE